MPENNDEINLKDYIKVIIKRKWLIVGITIGAAILAAILSFLIPKSYEADTILEIGKIGTDPIELPPQLVEKIQNGNYNKLIEKNLNIENLPSFKAENPQNTNLVIISINSSNSDEANKILEELNKVILAEHQEKLDKKRAEIEENIKDTQEELNLLETQKKYSEGIADLQINISNLRDQLNDLQPTKISKSPSLIKSESTNIIFNIIIALIIGLLIGIIIAFIREWWEKENITS